MINKVNLKVSKKISLSFFLCILLNIPLNASEQKNFNSGFYAGPQIGISFNHTKVNSILDYADGGGTAPAHASVKKNKKYLFGGGIVGYRHLFTNNIMLGGSLECDANNYKKKLVLQFDDDISSIITFKNKLLYTPSIMLGKSVSNKWLFFTRLGMNTKKIDIIADNIDNYITHKKKKKVKSIIIGIGGEYAFSTKISLVNILETNIHKNCNINIKNLYAPVGKDFMKSKIKYRTTNYKIALLYKF